MTDTVASKANVGRKEASAKMRIAKAGCEENSESTMVRGRSSAKSLSNRLH